VNGSLGDTAEGLMASDLYEHFAARGLDFDQSFQNYVLKDKKTKRRLAEVDMLLVNGTIAMAAVKTSPKARQYAIEKGFYMIELSGGTVRINVPEDFSPKTW
jgi:hypothetical protein